MDTDTFYQKEKEIFETYQQLAWEYFKKNYNFHAHDIKAPSEFGGSIHEKILGYINELSEEYESDFPALVSLAIREYDFACYKGAYYYRLSIEAGVMNDNTYVRGYTSPEGYATKVGYASALFTNLGELNKPTDYLANTPFLEIPSNSDLLNAISLYWFAKAAIHFSDQKIDDCFIFLHEAYAARALSDYEVTYYMLEDDAKNDRSSMARFAAKERLKRDPRQKEKQFINSCWQEWQNNPNRYSSKAAFARDMLDKCQHLVSSKKIEDWCREWEKPNSAG